MFKNWWLPQCLDGLLSSTEKWIPNLEENLRPFVHQKRMGDAIGQQPKTEINQQNGFNRRKYVFWSGPVRVLTSTWLRCCGMTSSKRFTPDIPQILLTWNSFVKRNGPKFLLTVVQVWSATTENVWLGYCCQRRVNQLLNPNAHIHFPHYIVNVYRLSSIKTWKHIFLWVCLFTQTVFFYDCDFSSVIRQRHYIFLLASL